MVRTSLTVESGWGTGTLASGADVGSGAPAEALLVTLRRAWKVAEGRRVAGADTIAPAGDVARAVGTLLLAAATHDLRGATRGAEAGCAAGVARTVEACLARQVQDALPPRGRAKSGEDREPIRAGEAPAAAGTGAGRANLPPASWWSREPAWSPRIVADATDLSRHGPHHTVIAQLWPPTPDMPDRSPAQRVPTQRRAWAADDVLRSQAWRVLEADLVPGRPPITSRPTSGGAR